MARAVGIDAGDFAVKAVELDGSYRKTRLVRCHVEPVPPATDGEDTAGLLAAAIQRTLTDGKLRGEVMLGHPCREAVLRTIEVPFANADAIRKVIKAEVEGAIHSHAVDDMVVDFHVLGQGAEGTRVLVAAVPKPSLRPLLEALQAEGIEPEHVDLDTMALYRVADWCGTFQAATDDDQAAALPALATTKTRTAVVDLGARSTRILLVEDGRLVDMRTLRLGDASVAEAVARAQSLSLDDARAAVQVCLATGEDHEFEVGTALPAPAAAATDEERPAAAAPELRRVLVTREAVDAEQAAFLQRLARELVRFLTASGDAAAIGALWITGSASRMNGMHAMLAEVFGVEPRELEVLGRLQHSFSDEEAAALAPQLATAIGLALARLGGPEGFDFRQEELAFTRGFDRLKFPLAITCMVALFTAVVYAVKLNNQLKNLEYRLGLTFTGDKADPKKPQFWGMLNAVLGSGWFTEERYFQLQEGGKEYGNRQLLQDLVALPVPDRLRFVRDKLARVLDKKEQESGIYEDVTLESGLAVLLRFCDVVEQGKAGIGKMLLCNLTLDMKAEGSGEKSGRSLAIDFAFRGEGFRERHAALKAVLEADCKRADSPFLQVEERVSEKLFSDEAETKVSGGYYQLIVVIKDSFAPF